MLVLALVAIWRRPDRDGGQRRRRANDAATWLASLWLVGIWLTTFTGETAPFDIGLAVLMLVLASLDLRALVDHLLRPTAETSRTTARPIAVVAIERGLRVAIVLAAVFVIAHSLYPDLTALAATNTPETRIARGVFSVLVIRLAADFVWQVSRA